MFQNSRAFQNPCNKFSRFREFCWTPPTFSNAIVRRNLRVAVLANAPIGARVVSKILMSIIIPTCEKYCSHFPRWRVLLKFYSPFRKTPSKYLIWWLMDFMRRGVSQKIGYWNVIHHWLSKGQNFSRGHPCKNVAAFSGPTDKRKSNCTLQRLLLNNRFTPLF